MKRKIVIPLSALCLAILGLSHKVKEDISFDLLDNVEATQSESTTESKDTSVPGTEKGAVVEGSHAEAAVVANGGTKAAQSDQSSAPAVQEQSSGVGSSIETANTVNANPNITTSDNESMIPAPPATPEAPTEIKVEVPPAEEPKPEEAQSSTEVKNIEKNADTNEEHTSAASGSEEQEIDKLVQEIAELIATQASNKVKDAEVKHAKERFTRCIQAELEEAMEPFEAKGATEEIEMEKSEPETSETASNKVHPEMHEQTEEISEDSSVSIPAHESKENSTETEQVGEL